MDNDSYDPALAAALSLTLIDYPNQYLGGRVVTQRGAAFITEHFGGRVPCRFHLPDGDLVFSVEELYVEDGQLVARAVAPSLDDMKRIHEAAQEDVEPVIRMVLKFPPDPTTGGLPARFDEAILAEVHVDLLARH